MINTTILYQLMLQMYQDRLFACGTVVLLLLRVIGWKVAMTTQHQNGFLTTCSDWFWSLVAIAIYRVQTMFTAHYIISMSYLMQKGAFVCRQWRQVTVFNSSKASVCELLRKQAPDEINFFEKFMSWNKDDFVQILWLFHSSILT